MMYTDFEVGNKTYKLRLNTRNTITLEKQLGCNPLAIFGLDGAQIPTVENMVYILYASLIQYNHGITLGDTYTIFDEWLDEGHVITDFIPIILEIYKVSGIINTEAQSEEEKN